MEALPDAYCVHMHMHMHSKYSHMYMCMHMHMHMCILSQVEELPDDYYVCVGLTALLLPCMLVLLSLWAPGKGVAEKPRSKRPSETTHPPALLPPFYNTQPRLARSPQQGSCGSTAVSTP